MVKIKNIKTFYSDIRGEIIDIFTNEPKDHCTLVTFTKNAIRGNHFHKKSVQSAYVLEGRFIIYSVAVNEKLIYNINKIKISKLTKGDYITHKEYEAHTYECISKKGSLLVFTKGVRGGIYFENDTFRLTKRLA